ASVPGSNSQGGSSDDPLPRGRVVVVDKACLLTFAGSLVVVRCGCGLLDRPDTRTKKRAADPVMVPRPSEALYSCLFGQGPRSARANGTLRAGTMNAGRSLCTAGPAPARGHGDSAPPEPGPWSLTLRSIPHREVDAATATAVPGRATSAAHWVRCRSAPVVRMNRFRISSTSSRCPHSLTATHRPILAISTDVVGTPWHLNQEPQTMSSSGTEQLISALLCIHHRTAPSNPDHSDDTPCADASLLTTTHAQHLGTEPGQFGRADTGDSHQ